MKSEIVRNIDQLDRIVLPSDMRNALGWDTVTKISIIKSGQQLILKAYQGNCLICGSEETLQPVKDKFICRDCIEKIHLEMQ